LFQQFNAEIKAVSLAEDEVKEEIKEEVEVKAAEAELEDGTIVYTDSEEWSVGAGVYVLNEADEQIPLPDGEYTLAIGGGFVIEGGSIASLIEGVAEEVVEDEIEVDMSKYATKEELSEVMEAVNQIAQNFASMVEEFKAEKQTVQQMAEATAAKPLSKAPNGSSINIQREPVNLSQLRGVELVKAIQSQLVQ
jgi:hypothetical protein